MSNRTKSTALNLQFGVFNQVLSMILNFVGRTVFIQVLGVGYLGINGLFTDILTLLSLADLGLRTSMAYSFYAPLAEKDYEKVAMLTHFYKKIYHSIAIGVTLIGLSLIPFLNVLVNLDAPVPHLNLYYVLFLANTVVSYLFVYKTSVIEADQRLYLITKYQMIVNLSKICLQIIILLLTQYYIAYLVIQVLATLANNIIASRKADILYPSILEKSRNLSKQERKSIFNNMSSMFLYKASTSVISGTDNIIISLLFGTIWVGIYSNYNLVIASLYNFICIIYTSVTASIGNVLAVEKSEKKYKIFKDTVTFTLMLATFTSVCLYVLLNDLISVWLGTSFVINMFFLIAIIINFYLRVIIHPVASFRQASGLYVQTKYVMVIAAILNIGLSLLFGYTFGIAGVLLASAVSRLCTHFWYEPILLFKLYFKKSTKDYFVNIAFNVLLTLGITIVLINLFSGFIIDSWTKLIIKAISVGIITLISVTMFYFKTEEFHRLLKKVTSKVIIFSK